MFGPRHYTKINHELQGVSALRHQSAGGQITIPPKIVFQTGNHHALTGGSVNELAASQVDAYVAVFVRGFEKNEVSGTQLAVVYPSAAVHLGLGGPGQLDTKQVPVEADRQS